MSEQTPDTETGMADGQDPSMEDILASIRKIIAEDDIPTPSAADSMIADAVADAPSLSGDVSELVKPETLDLDIITDEAPAIDPDIEALIGDMDAEVSDDLTSAVESAASPVEESLDDILELEIPMDETEVLAESEPLEAVADVELVETETLTLEDELIDLVEEPEPDVVEDQPKESVLGGAMAAMGLGGVIAATAKGEDVSPEVETSEDDGLSLMLDNMLEDSASYEEGPSDFAEETIIDPAEDLIAEDDSGEDLLAELDFVEDAPETSEVISKSDPDIALVKSLMADLTETPLHDDGELADIGLEDTEIAEAEITDSEAVESLLGENDEVDASSDDIMDEILAITIDDETKLSEELAIPEIDVPSTEEIPAESLSLKEIAAAAEADAQASEEGLSGAMVAGVAAAAAGTAAVVASQDDTPDTQTPQETVDDEEAVDDTDTILTELDNILAEDKAAEPEILTPEPPIEETPEMPRAKKTDAIIDEVTETATAGAFASLTNVVEEKATVAERGDRIGDLVQEALKPMLKEWLDANLKGIVERAVTKEVKRISSGK